jgi:PRTRC genetic system protein C
VIVTTSVQTPTNQPRVFKYLDHTIDDPGPEYSIEQVRQALVPFFPELSRSTVQEETLPSGAVQVIFTKQATTKGSVIGEVAERLQALPPADDPLGRLLQELAPPLTLQGLLTVREGIRAYASQGERTGERTRKAVAQCFQLQPIPLGQCPVGF